MSGARCCGCPSTVRTTRSGRRPLPLEHVGQLATDHQPDDLASRSARRPVATATSCPSRITATRSASRRISLMRWRHVDDRDTLVAQPPDEPEQPLDLLVGERRGRLVEGEDPDAGLERAHDLDELALGRRELVAHQRSSAGRSRSRSAAGRRRPACPAACDRRTVRASAARRHRCSRRRRRRG